MQISRLTRTQLVLLALGGAALVAAILIGAKVLPGVRSDYSPKATIRVWAAGEDGGALARAIALFEKARAGVSVSYQEFHPGVYEEYLLDSLAAGEGPDVLVIDSTWLPKHINKLIPAPSSLVSAESAARLFPKVVSEDFVRGGKVYALPLSIDTLALYYNRDIFDKRGVALFPTTWDEVQNLALVKKVPTALGGDKRTVSKAGDIVSLLMLQYGAEMGSADRTRATFATSSAAQAALDFYLGFTPPDVDSLRGFSSGKVGMMIDYSSARSAVKTANPLLNFAVLPVPQRNAESPSSAAEYSGFAVSRRSRNPVLAWEFVRFIAADEGAAEEYLRASRRPPALRALIERYARNPELGVFAEQTLAAESWPKGDTGVMRAAFSDMVQSARERRANLWEALSKAEDEINRTLKTF